MEEEIMNMQQQQEEQQNNPAAQPEGMLFTGGGDMAMDDPFNSPTPGESLTKNPEEKFA
jgi:hypothetical protein